MQRRELILGAAAAATAMVGSGAHALTATPPETGKGRKMAASGAAPRLRIRDWGTGKPILFLAGWALPSDFWQYHMVDFTERGYRCVAYDRRGHGRSDDPGHGYDYTTLASDLAAVIESQDLHDLTVVAYSMAGGELARYLSTARDARVSKAIFVSCTSPFLTRTDDNPTGVPAAMFDGLRKAVAADFPKWIADSEAAFWLGMASPEMQAWARSLLLQASLPALIACNRTMASTDLRDDFRRIAIPSLVIHGDKDASAPLPVTGKPTADLIRNSRFSLYPGAPHGLPYTHRARFVDDVVGFIES